jgi:VanZ family protein
MYSKNLIIVLSVALLAFIVFAALGPAKLIPRTGLGWQVDHFTGYLVFTALFCSVWGRVFAVGASMTSFAIVLEICQGLTPDRAPDLMGAFYSTSGILTATLLADFALRSRKLIFDRSFMRAP